MDSIVNIEIFTHTDTQTNKMLTKYNENTHEYFYIFSRLKFDVFVFVFQF